MKCRARIGKINQSAEGTICKLSIASSVLSKSLAEY